MADPAHTPDLDGFDRLTVALYRTGLAVSGLLLLVLTGIYGARAAGLVPPPDLLLPLLAGLAATVTVSTVCVHLYDKRMRWFIGASAPGGLALLAVGGTVAEPGAWILQVGGVGFALVSLSALAVKEWFCFRIPLLPATPAFLGLGVLAVLIDLPWAVALLWGPAAILVLALTVAKVRMPLGHDVGDRTKYQV